MQATIHTESTGRAWRLTLTNGFFDLLRAIGTVILCVCAVNAAGRAAVFENLYYKFPYPIDAQLKQISDSTVDFATKYARYRVTALPEADFTSAAVPDVDLAEMNEILEGSIAELFGSGLCGNAKASRTQLQKWNAAFYTCTVRGRKGPIYVQSVATKVGFMVYAMIMALSSPVGVPNQKQSLEAEETFSQLRQGILFKTATVDSATVNQTRVKPTRGATTADLVGKWTGSSKSSFAIGEEYKYTFEFRRDGSFIYEVEQIASPSWEISIHGKYEIGGRVPNLDSRYTSSIRFLADSASYSRAGRVVRKEAISRGELMRMDETGVPHGDSLIVLGVAPGYTPDTAHFKIPRSCSVCELIVERTK